VCTSRYSCAIGGHVKVKERDAARAAGDRPLVTVTGLRGGYGDLEVLHGIDVHVAPGETVALLGPNGAGKTTFLQMLVGQLVSTGGHIDVLGTAVKGPLKRAVRKHVTVVPEQGGVIRSLSVRDNLLLGSGSVAGAVAIFPELGRLLDRNAGLLSGGEQQMLTVSRALATKPLLFIADELSLGLAPQMVRRLMHAIHDYVSTTGAAALLVEQQVRRALEVSDRWYLMRGGRILADSSMADSANLLNEHYLFGTVESSIDDGVEA